MDDAALGIPFPPEILKLLESHPVLTGRQATERAPVPLTEEQRSALLALFLDRGNWYHGLFSVVCTAPPFYFVVRVGNDFARIHVNDCGVVSVFLNGESPPRSAMLNETGKAKYDQWLKGTGLRDTRR
ncbi:hypothetical protein SAMN05444156_2343 [Verrucomicrobium sp. GAS474]|nr:hypothetical protein SAMN05444156_2343 [Verrucomicrobium sp. GAS474]